MKKPELSEGISVTNNFSKDKESVKGKEKIDSWIDDIIKQHKKRD
jgi:hypothetical protein